tara:strand:+ start:1071 stop:1907 length:837 start_codon:yes stop_codon:yes gene_type:complete
MSTETGRDDFIISIRSAFLKKGTRQKFSIFTLLIISVIVLSLEYFKSGPVNKFRSFTKDLIFKGSYFISTPFIFFEDKYYLFKDHMKLYEEYSNYKNKKIKLDSLEKENQFLKSENNYLKNIIDDRNDFSKDFLITKVLIDNQSPYLKSVIINKGFNHGIKIGVAVKDKFYFVGKIVGVNYLTSRVLLASDLNSKIPIIIEPGRINAILSGNGNNNYADLEYLPKQNNIKSGDLVFTSGTDATIPPAIPIGKIIEKDKKKFVKFFSNFDQLKYVKVSN